MKKKILYAKIRDKYVIIAKGKDKKLNSLKRAMEGNPMQLKKYEIEELLIK